MTTRGKTTMPLTTPVATAVTLRICETGLILKLSAWHNKIDDDIKESRSRRLKESERKQITC
jgi:hypothetical protein